MKTTSLSLLAAASLGLALASNLVGAQTAEENSTTAPAQSATPASTGHRHGGGRGMPEGSSGRDGQHAGHGQRGAGSTERQERRAAMEKLTTPEERAAFREKMRAATPEQRHQIGAANRAELQQRAQAQGITLPEARGGHHGGHGARGDHGQGRGHGYDGRRGVQPGSGASGETMVN